MDKMILFFVVMAAVTYIPRALPFLLIKGQIKSPFIRSFLHYIPYSVLAAMTFPAIFYICDSFIASAVGTAVALVLAYFKKGLLTVALCAVAAVFICLLIV